MCPLPLCYSNYSQKCERKTMNKEETEKNKAEKLDISI